MGKRRFDLRGVVIGWTILTTTFAWTPSMRLLLKPEISSWRIFDIGGSAGTGPFWVLPLVATTALFLFYIEGRGRLRPLSHLLLFVWHAGLTAALVYGSIRSGADATFMGAAWGVSVPFAILAIPFGFFAVLTLILIARERSGVYPVPVMSWRDVHWRKLGLAAILLPVALILYRLGDGFDTIVKLAIVATVLQWILLAEGLGRQQAGTATRRRLHGGGV
jgi:hypothetical protein